jgi:hypothetical protein
MSAPTNHRRERAERATPELPSAFTPAALEAIRNAELALVQVVRAMGWQQRRLAHMEARLAAGDTKQARSTRSGTIEGSAGQCRRKIGLLRLKVAEAELAHQRAWSEAVAEACTRPATTPLATVDANEDGEEE